ncbi:MAG: NTP transferase domain-containing protein [Clostridia bacterium]|nr:NTP transferase domain-containing protein [Clostridia bacterium]
MVGLILAAGDGRRFSGEGCCKPLLKINGSYLIEYSLRNLEALGANEAFIVVGKYAPDIKAALGEEFRGMKITYVLQPRRAGLIDAVRCACPVLPNDTVCVLLCDEIFIGAEPEKVNMTDGSDFICGYTVPADRDDIKENYAVFCDGDRILRTVEKPKKDLGEKKGSGFCVFRRECFDALDEPYFSSGEGKELCDFINYLILKGKTGIALEIAKEEINVNDPEKLAYAKRLSECSNE